MFNILKYEIGFRVSKITIFYRFYTWHGAEIIAFQRMQLNMEEKKFFFLFFQINAFWFALMKQSSDRIVRFGFICLLYHNFFIEKSTPKCDTDVWALYRWITNTQHHNTCMSKCLSLLQIQHIEAHNRKFTENLINPQMAFDLRSYRPIVLYCSMEQKTTIGTRSHRN